MNVSLVSIRQRLSTHYEENEAQAIAFLLLEKCFDLTRMDIYMGKDRHFSEDELDKLDNILRRLEENEPLQYILGEADFCGFTFHVGPGVLIPRPETEELVRWIARDYKEQVVRIVDIGTGSGCIAISLEKLLVKAQVSGWDLSLDALAIASDNASHLGSKVVFQQKDALHLPDVCEEWDVLVSNPPYVCEKEKDTMEKNVLSYEPNMALFVPDSDPLLFYRAIAKWGRKALVPGGRLYFEINRAYGDLLVKILETMGYVEVEKKKDVFDNDRMIKAEKPIDNEKIAERR